MDLGKLDPKVGAAIVQAAQEVAEGEARGTLADAARPGQIAGERTAQGRHGLAGAEDRAPIARLEGEHLARPGKRRLDFGKGRRGAAVSTSSSGS